MDRVVAHDLSRHHGLGFLAAKGAQVSRILSALALSILSAQVVAAPADAVAAALRHARSLTPDPTRQQRYLDLSHLPKDHQADAYRVLSFHLNSLSREPDIIRPIVLEGGALLAFDLRDYGIDRLTYGKLADADPYFHAQVDVTVNKKTSRETVAAPWLPAGPTDELYRLLDTRVPVLRGDWFLYATAVQAQRAAGYYDMLGLGKKEADFQKLIGANAAESKRLKLEMAASVASSTVALHNRGISRLQSLTGGYWITLDFKTSTDRQNTARLLAGDTQPPNGDASEQYGVLPNRLFAYWLQDAKGNRQDTAPDDIASDGRSTSPDRRVQPMLSCVRCHTPGLQPIDDYARRLFRGPLQLVSPDYERLKRLRQLYLSDLPGQLADDNARYASAVLTANGLAAADNARLYGAFWEAYSDTPVSPAAAARELGCTEEHLVQVVKAYVARGQIVDPIVAAFAQPGMTITRFHLEEAYPVFQAILGGRP